MTNDPKYQEAVTNIAESMHEIIREVETNDPTLSIILQLETGALRDKYGERIAEIDSRIEQIIERFGVTVDQVEEDVARAIMLIEQLHLPFVGTKSFTVH
jgi:hypothetical protein